MKESDLFFPVKNFLKSSGCKEVYGEVSNFDVLGLFDVCNVGVELKKSLSFKLLDQAIDRLNYVEYLYIAIPKRKAPIPFSVRKILELYKIGLLVVENEVARIEIPARFNRRSIRLNRKLNYNIRNQVKDYHKNEIGGVRSGEGRTDYSIMIENIKVFLEFYKRGQGATIDEILKHCETHYANPRPSLVATLKEDWNKEWCEITVKNGERYYNLIQKGVD